MADSFHVKVEVEEESSKQPDSSCSPEIDSLIVIIVVEDLSQVMENVRYNSMQSAEGKVNMIVT